MIAVRPMNMEDEDAVWAMLEPVIRSGETYTLPRDMTREQALQFWCAPGNTVFIAEQEDEIAGTYLLRANQKGGGSHVANCGYVTAPHASGRGVARAMCAHSLEYAKAQGFRGMQFNFVVSTNAAAVHLWEKLGFVTLCRIPEAFLHPKLGYVDALVMHRFL